MTIGTVGLIWFKLKSDAVPAGSTAPAMDYMFLVMLCLTSLSGLFTLVFRAASAMGTILVVHLGFVAALFITAPYGKFVHVGVPFSGTGEISNRIRPDFPEFEGALR